MATSDPIADMLTRIRNGVKAKFGSVDIPASRMNVELAKILKNEGFIRNYKVIRDDKQGVLKVFLKYTQKQSTVILGIERVSKPSRRVYVRHKDIKPILNGTGISIISTSRGVMTDTTAVREKVGGEVLCNVW